MMLRGYFSAAAIFLCSSSMVLTTTATQDASVSTEDMIASVSTITEDNKHLHERLQKSYVEQRGLDDPESKQHLASPPSKEAMTNRKFFADVVEPMERLKVALRSKNTNGHGRRVQSEPFCAFNSDTGDLNCALDNTPIPGSTFTFFTDCVNGAPLTQCASCTVINVCCLSEFVSGVSLACNTCFICRSEGRVRYDCTNVGTGVCAANNCAGECINAAPTPFPTPFPVTNPTPFPTPFPVTNPTMSTPTIPPPTGGPPISPPPVQPTPLFPSQQSTSSASGMMSAILSSVGLAVAGTTFLGYYSF